MKPAALYTRESMMAVSPQYTSSSVCEERIRVTQWQIFNLIVDVGIPEQGYVGIRIAAAL